MATITIKKSRDYNPMPGRGNAEWYGFAFADGKRIGTVWKFNDGNYVCNEDYNQRVHSRENRAKQFKGRTLKDLKADIAAVI